MATNKMLWSSIYFTYIHLKTYLSRMLSAFPLMKEKEGKKENVLFNDALNTFYLRLYGVRHMAKDHSGSTMKDRSDDPSLKEKNDDWLSSANFMDWLVYT